VVACGVPTGFGSASNAASIHRGDVVIVMGSGNFAETTTVPLFELAMFQKPIQGVLYGIGSPRNSVPQLLDLYVAGRPHLDELITTRYRLEQINEGYADMHAGKNIRGVIDFEH
jgi:S-(hydroxymethyl)glutathione dehydrogenase/alcohol dehydrogenase